MSNNAESKYLFWDLEETVGKFEATKYLLTQDNRLSPMRADVKREGIEKLLTELLGRNYKHILTTGLATDLGEQILQKAGLVSYFQHIFGQEKVTTDIPGKCYRPVIEDLGIDEGTALRRCLVIGDLDGDCPVDNLPLVFLREPQGVSNGIEPLKSVIHLLEITNPNDFSQAFTTIFTNAPESPGSSFFWRRIVTDSAECLLEHNPLPQIDERTVSVPKIIILRR